jgi:hypothetical protein
MYGLAYFVYWDTMDFGTEQNPQCGICNRSIIDRNSICSECSEGWEWEDNGQDKGYIRNDHHPIVHLIHHHLGWKYAEGFGTNDDIPFIEWYFYYDNDQLSQRIVRRNWVRSKYRYWNIE